MSERSFVENMWDTGNSDNTYFGEHYSWSRPNYGELESLVDQRDLGCVSRQEFGRTTYLVDGDNLRALYEGRTADITPKDEDIEITDDDRAVIEYTLQNFSHNYSFNEVKEGVFMAGTATATAGLGLCVNRILGNNED